MPNQLIDVFNFDATKIIFSDPEEKKIPNDSKLTYYTVNVKIQNPDGTKGDLIFNTGRCMSYGINTEYDTPSISVQFFDRDGPTEYQKAVIDCIEKITQRAREYLVEKRKALGLPKLEESDLKELGFVKYKTNEDGDIDLTKSPTASIKLMQRAYSSDKNGESVKLDEPEVLSKFYDEDDEDLEVDWKNFEKKRCFVTCAIKIQSIFINKMTKKLQTKLVECNIKSQESEPTRLLKSFKGLTVNGLNSSLAATGISKEDNLKASDFEEETTAPALEASDDEQSEEEEPKEEVEKPKRGRGRKSA